VAYRLLLNEHAPGWLYQVLNGATTTWERWDAIEADGAIHAGAMESGGGSSMISFNHYAYGSVAAWLFRSLAGIGPSDVGPGYSRIQFSPQPGDTITWADASVQTPFGPAAIRWERSESALTITVKVPPGTRGRIQIPEGWTTADEDAGLEFGSGTRVLVLAASRAFDQDEA
jgi:alpha-L-rhamnosidase